MVHKSSSLEPVQGTYLMNPPRLFRWSFTDCASRNCWAARRGENWKNYIFHNFKASVILQYLDSLFSCGTERNNGYRSTCIMARNCTILELDGQNCTQSRRFWKLVHAFHHFQFCDAVHTDFRNWRSMCNVFLSDFTNMGIRLVLIKTVQILYKALGNQIFTTCKLYCKLSFFHGKKIEISSLPRFYSTFAL